MPFSVGTVELIALLLAAVTVAFLSIRRHRFKHVAIVFLVCLTLASLTTPPDIVSTSISFIAFACTFLFGAKYRLKRVPIVA